MSDQKRDSDFDDKTAIKQKPNDDETAVRRGKDGDNAESGQSPADGGESAGQAGQDETVIRDRGEQRPEADSTADETVLRNDDRRGRESSRDSSDDATRDDKTRRSSESATLLRSPDQPSGEGATILREPTPSNEHATILRGSSADGEVATVLRDGDGGGASEDSTVLRDGAQQDDDGTVINKHHDDDATVVGDGRREADTTYVASAGGQTRSRGNSEAGRLLKNRFVLEEKVGSGGMGDVYKALDLRQQEARERNPYIAIKILNENFARHKDAFISLQREATRTRGIPHPNIMAVYDFDREGDTVFMSMELLDGKPLDDYLKDHPEGVSVEDAWQIIDGICQGLSRAHGAGIVHSDFKPGNIYYCADKTAKVFDFGIARAVAAPGDLQSDGEKTVFDAGSLGALTPTYASLEMLTGKEPTKSDDVYAVALVAYELFTGRHPYNRTSADKALERGLEPEPVPFLKRRHWRALKKGLALKAEDRYETIDEFYEGMFSEDPPIFRYAAIAAVLMLSIGGGIYSYFNVEERPPALIEMQGSMQANKNNLENRIGDPVNWRFSSEDWRLEVRQSLNRLRGIDQRLVEEFGEEWDIQPDADVGKWKDRVLNAYLTKVRSMRGEVANIEIPAVQADDQEALKANEELAQQAVEKLEAAELYLSEAKQHFNFDSEAIRNEESILTQVLGLWRNQHNQIVADIEAAIAAEEAAIAAAKAEEERRQFLAQREETYGELRQEFAHILRCKGDLTDGEIADIDRIINGQNGMKATWEAQWQLDKPGVVQALRGCITQRIGVRAPERARDVRDRILQILPGEPQLASIVIEDLDPCAVRNLEGRGVRNGSWCSDRLATGGTGPELVVIPPLDTKSEKYAISRIEIKVSDYNQFCEETGCEKVDAPRTLPVTNISLEQAQAYTDWLSAQTGREYRLPTPEEWLHAARTDEDEPLDDNINCTVDSRGVRLGDTLLSTLSGRPNHWGLYNYVGNAREWAVSEDSVVALGGAHTDPKSECTIEKRVAHSGDPDPVTGFRVVRQVEG